MRRLLFDWKTVHAGTARYRTARARDRQSGAVEERAQQVHPAYMLHPPLVGRKDKTVRKENRESATYTVYGKYCKAVHVGERDLDT